MAIFDIFSKRQKRIRGDVPDVYSYDRIPAPLRMQIVHILRDLLGNERDYDDPFSGTGRIYYRIERILCREYGVDRLPVTYGDMHRARKIDDIFEFLCREQNVEKILDVVQVCFSVAMDLVRERGSSDPVRCAIDELNRRFVEHGVGYCFSNRQIVRIDSEFVHAEVVKPALRILVQSRYAGAQEEFLRAHKHYRDGNGKEAINECSKAFESTMKSICNQRGWRYDEKAGASKLIGICFDNGLVPAYWRSHFDALRSLRSTLASGAPTARNRLSGHGQGEIPTSVPTHIVGYVLHMTAAAIVFLAEAEASGDK